ncbi:MAG TPA: 2-oxoacid:acceptor oxidoreductase family protein, partial [Ktedonobacteraceae bacterium]
DAERVIVAMGSGAETAQETVKALMAQGEKVGVVKVHLFRPFSVEHFLHALPATARTVAVLDRTKEPGSIGEPLYLDVVAAINEGQRMGLDSQQQSHIVPRVIGGRYGLASKELTPAMVKGIFDEMSREKPKNHFTVGIYDDVTQSSLGYDPLFSIDDPATVQCVFWGLGSDGTVGANKNSIKIIGEETDNHAQGYFVYDSKKSGSVTISHLRFGPHPIHAPYQVSNEQAAFVACHQYSLLERFPVLKYAKRGGTFLLNSIYSPEEVWEHLPVEVRQAILEKELRFYVIDAYKVAGSLGMGGRVNTVMQTCFFALSGILPREEAIEQIKRSIRKTYGKRGEAVVQRNFRAVDETLKYLYEVRVSSMDDNFQSVQVVQMVGQEAGVALVAPEQPRHRAPIALPMVTMRPPVPTGAPAFVRQVLGPMIAGEGDTIPVSALPADGTYPSGTARWEKRNISLEVPVWDPTICIQCGKCTMVCPHAVIREKVYEPSALQGAPATFHSTDAHFKEFPGMKYTLQVSPEDCTGCALCVEACPVKDKQQIGRKAINMEPQPPLREPEKKNWEFFLTLPEIDRTVLNLAAIKDTQLLQPLFEFSGACSGCGETPYIKLATQLFGDRMLVANATGCSSIYGGNLPTTPWSCNNEGRGPSWSNSLFEDNAEFGLGMRLTLDKMEQFARELLSRCVDILDGNLVGAILDADQSTEKGIMEQRARVAELKYRLQNLNGEVQAHQQLMSTVQMLLQVVDVLVRKTVWIIGGDGWAYDIGFGGLDHVLASGRNVNVLVLDTEVYSNTGGQASKSTPRAAVAKFAAKGKALPKKDLGLLAMAYGNVYVARVAMGANDQQTLKAFIEAEAYDGPSLVIAYSHCIAHGIDMRRGLDQQKRAVQAGYWPLYRYNPALQAEGKNPLVLDSKEPKLPLEEYAYNETRYRMLLQSDEERAENLMRLAEQDIHDRWELYQ